MVVSFGETVWDEIADASASQRSLGGVACSVASHVRLLGGVARLVSAVGADTAGDEALVELERRGLATHWVHVIPEANTARVLVQRESSGPRYAALARLDWSGVDFSDTLESAIRGADALLFALFLQGTRAPLHTLERALAGERKRPGWVGCDLNLRHATDCETISRAVELVDFVKANEAELGRVGEVCGTTAPAAMLLSEHEQLAFVVETRGASGARLISRDGVVEFEAPWVACAAHSLGAGDSFMAALLYALVREEGPESALRAAVRYASAYVARASERDSQ